MKTIGWTVNIILMILIGLVVFFIVSSKTYSQSEIDNLIFTKQEISDLLKEKADLPACEYFQVNSNDYGKTAEELCNLRGKSAVMAVEYESERLFLLEEPGAINQVNFCDPSNEIYYDTRAIVREADIYYQIMPPGIGDCIALNAQRGVGQVIEKGVTEILCC